MTDPVEIYVLDKRVKLLQPVDGFRTSLDSVMLAAACPAKLGQSVLDLGCGVGGAGLCVLERVKGTCLTGVDIQFDHIEMARENAVMNKAQAEFIVSDIMDFRSDERFDHVICNPPYMEEGAHTPSPKIKKATAHGHDLLVKDWIDAGFEHLKSGGSYTMIHRADMTDKIIQGMGKRFGAIEIIPLWPRAGQNAKRVIVRSVKDRKTPATLHAGIVLHQEDGSYTDAADAILRGLKEIA